MSVPSARESYSRVINLCIPKPFQSLNSLPKACVVVLCLVFSNPNNSWLLATMLSGLDCPLPGISRSLCGVASVVQDLTASSVLELLPHLEEFSRSSSAPVAPEDELFAIDHLLQHAHFEVLCIAKELLPVRTKAQERPVTDVRRAPKLPSTPARGLCAVARSSAAAYAHAVY